MDTYTILQIRISFFPFLVAIPKLVHLTFSLVYYNVEHVRNNLFIFKTIRSTFD